jgi:phosphohistidine phosphatase SixA
LTEDGKEKVRQAAAGLLRLEVRPAALFTSPYARAMETAELFARILEFPREQIRRTDALLPGAAPASFLAELATADADEVLAFGHAPNLDLLVAWALGSRRPVTELGKAGAVCLELSPDDRRPRGMLRWLFTPALLRRLA